MTLNASCLTSFNVTLILLYTLVDPGIKRAQSWKPMKSADKVPLLSNAHPPIIWASYQGTPLLWWPFWEQFSVLEGL